MTITAKVIADSIGEQAPRITTLQLRYPKFIHGEFMTHRVFSRNASSSRAIPVERLIKDVIEDPVYPSFWGKNQPGMQAVREVEGGEKLQLIDIWNEARKEAVHRAEIMAKLQAHKQIVNRLLEPFCHINVVVTATEWENFFALRCHKDAQPEMRILADAIRLEMAASVPKLLRVGEWHTPYVEMDPEYMLEKSWEQAIKLSVARCARVSYLTQEGKTPNIEEDLKLYERLVGGVPIHASPAEHQAMPDKKYQGAFDGGEWINPRLHGNFTGHIQYRKQLELLLVEGKANG